MAELTIPFARRSRAEGTAHLIAGLMARCAGRAFGGFAKRMAARRTIAQLSALDDRTLHDIGSIAAKSPRAGSTSAPISAGATIEHDLLNAVVQPASRRQALLSRHASGCHSITSSALEIMVEGRVIPRRRAVLRLTTNSKREGCWIGRSPGLAPFKIRST